MRRVDLSKCEVGTTYIVQLRTREEPVRITKCTESGMAFRFDAWTTDDMWWRADGDCMSNALIAPHNYDIVRIFEPQAYHNWNTNMHELADLILSTEGSNEKSIAVGVSKTHSHAVMIQKHESNDAETGVNVLLLTGGKPVIAGHKTSTSKERLVKWLAANLVCWNRWPQSVNREYLELQKELENEPKENV